MSTIVAKYKRLDVAFNNAGIGHKAVRIEEITEEMFDRVMKVRAREKQREERREERRER